MSEPLRKKLGAACLAVCYARYRLTHPKRRRRSIADRLAVLPTRDLPLRDGIEIRWNDRHVPYIEARGQRDLAVGTGVVHAHLRLFQMEMMRRLAWGRLSEIFGPLALELDRSLRIVGFTRSVADIERRMSTETRVWLEGFRDGVNAVIASAPEHPEEFGALGIEPGVWTLADLVAIGRLAASDFSWKVLRRLLPHSRRADWPDAWEKLLAENGPATPSFSGRAGDAPFERAFACFNRGGSNSLAVAAERSATGGALIASDPHLGIMLPNSWLIAGLRVPGFHAVGLMIPGIPVIAIGRNADIAWGGTSLHAASSDLFDVSDLAGDEITSREETIAVRWGRDERVTVRETAYGPIVSDAPMLGLPPDRPIAMRWIGHDPNDEIGAMLGVARATDWESFRDALEGFAAPAQTMVYADRHGRVGQAVAAHLPRRPAAPPEDIVQRRAFADHWQSIATGHDFPSTFAPDKGFVASANNRPPASAIPAGFFFSPNDRVRRIAALIEDAGTVSPEALKALQRDVEMPSAAALRDRMVSLMNPAAAALPIVTALTEWNGRHDACSPGALAYELMIYHFLHHLHADSDIDLYLASWDVLALLRRDLDALPRSRLGPAATEAAKAAQTDFARHGTWGAIHRLRLEHPFARVPVIGHRYKFTDDPVAGGNETLMKTAHGVSRDVHRVNLGAIARHVSDLADPDANDFCLLGGQDGWIGSETFDDQYPLWRDGRYIRVPLSAAAVAMSFPRVVTLRPAGSSTGAEDRLLENAHA